MNSLLDAGTGGEAGQNLPRESRMRYHAGDIVARTKTLVLALALWGGTAPANAQERGRVLGTVKDAAGKPVAGAVVTLISRPIPARADVGSIDRVEVKTDERGLFRASVLRGRGYSAWAEAKVGDGDGVGDLHKRRLSKPADEVVPGPTVHLVLGEPVGPRHVVVRGREAWKDFEPLTFAMRYDARNVIVVPFSVDAKKGVGVSPPGPTSRTLLVRAKNGMLVHKSLRPRIEKTPDGRRWIVELAEPIRVRVRAVDTAKLPIAGARVWQNTMQNMGGGMVGMYPTLLGTTGKDGSLSVLIPKTLSPDATRQMKPIFMVEGNGPAATQIFYSVGPTAPSRCNPARACAGGSSMRKANPFPI